MYTLLQANINFQKRKIKENPMLLSKCISVKNIKKLETEIKQKKQKIKEDPDIFLSDDSSISSNEENNSDTSNKNYSYNFFVPYYRQAEIKTKITNNYISKKLKIYKKRIKILNIILITLVLVTGFLIQLQNEHVINKYKKQRILLAKLLRCLKNDTLQIQNSTVINITCDNNYLNSTEFDNIFNTKNFLQKTNLNNFRKTLELDNYDITFRYIILDLTIISIIMNIILRKMQYSLEFTYYHNKYYSFWKSDEFQKIIIETLILLIIPYPKIKTIFFYNAFGIYFIIPLTTYFCSLSLLRIFFLSKILSSLTRWTSTKNDFICKKFGCNANNSFAFKAFQKEHPFIILIIIFISTCIICGLSIRNFEILFWEQKEESSYFQEWENVWNSVWFIFVSMTTVGYGDFYPKTIPGRIYTLICCLVGCYFESSMMVNMTKLTAKNEKEEKAFNLILVVENKNKIKDNQSILIYCSLKYVSKMKLINKCIIKNGGIKRNLLKEKTEIYNKMLKQITIIKKIKQKLKTRNVDFNKDLLIEICERISSDIQNIKYELNYLGYLVKSMKYFTDIQSKSLSNLKKDYKTIKLFYYTMQNNPKIFPIFDSLKLDGQLIKILNEDFPNKKKSGTPIIRKSKFNLNFEKNFYSIQKPSKHNSFLCEDSKFLFNSNNKMKNENSNHEVNKLYKNNFKSPKIEREQRRPMSCEINKYSKLKNKLGFENLNNENKECGKDENSSFSSDEKESELYDIRKHKNYSIKKLN